MTTSITGQGITAYKVPDDALSNESKNAVQNKVVNEEVTDLQNAISQKADKTVATTTADGLMSASDKTKLDDVYADYSSALVAMGVI